MQSALAAGTKDARLWYHAGLIALRQRADGRGARRSSADALALGPALDPIARAAGHGGAGDDPMRRPSAPLAGARLLGARARAARRRRRARPPARQLHDQPLRGHPRRAGSGPARRRHRRGRDPDVPGDARASTRRRRRRSPMARPRPARRPRCASSVGGLTLDRRRRGALAAELSAAGSSFPPGNGGLSTMRLVCTFGAPLAARSPPARTIAFADDFEPTRIGWREMAVVGSGVTVASHGLPAASATSRLTAYPTDLAGLPLDVRSRRRSTVRPAWRAPRRRSRRRTPRPPTAPAAPAASRRRRLGAARPVPAVTRADCPTSSATRRPRRPSSSWSRSLTAAALGAGHALTPGPRQDADGGLPRRHARDAAPRRRARPGRQRVAHARDPRAGGARARRPRRVLPPDLVVRIAPLVAAVSILVDRRLDAVHGGPAGDRGAPRASPQPTTRTTTSTRTSTSTTTGRSTPTTTTTARRTTTRADAADDARALARRRPPHPPAARRLDRHLAQPVRPRARRRPRPVGQRAADPPRDDRRRAGRRGA